MKIVNPENFDQEMPRDGKATVSVVAPGPAIWFEATTSFLQKSIWKLHHGHSIDVIAFPKPT